MLSDHLELLAFVFGTSVFSAAFLFSGYSSVDCLFRILIAWTVAIRVLKIYVVGKVTSPLGSELAMDAPLQIPWVLPGSLY